MGLKLFEIKAIANPIGIASSNLCSRPLIPISYFHLSSLEKASCKTLLTIDQHNINSDNRKFSLHLVTILIVDKRKSISLRILMHFHTITANA